MGEKVTAINDTAVESYRQTLAILKDCGPHVAIDVQRRGTRDLVLPTGIIISLYEVVVVHELLQVKV